MKGSGPRWRAFAKGFVEEGKEVGKKCRVAKRRKPEVRGGAYFLADTQRDLHLPILSAGRDTPLMAVRYVFQNTPRTLEPIPRMILVANIFPRD